MTLVLTGFEDHGVSLLLYKDKLVLTNRGGHSGKFTGCAIYKLRKPFAEADFRNFMVEILEEEASVFIDKLKEFVDIDNPELHLKLKPQNWGTCTFVNAKSAIYAIIHLILQEIAEKPINPEESYQLYKSFTIFVREDEIDNLIEKTNQKHTAEERMLYLTLIKSILKTHNDCPPKEQGLLFTLKQSSISSTERSRAVRLWLNLPEDYIVELLKDETFTEHLPLSFIQAVIKEKKRKRSTDEDNPDEIEEEDRVLERSSKRSKV
jgi:hypothetical protein